MHVGARVPCKPGFHHVVFVRAVVVHDQVHVVLRRGLLVNDLEELDPFLVPMMLHALADQPCPSIISNAAKSVVVPWFL